MRRAWYVLRQEPWVWSLIILNTGLFFMPIYYASRLT
jgi:hypothetical protein